jgi:hypothetical protein
MKLRIRLVYITLFLALFYSPLSVTLSKLTGGLIGVGITELFLIAIGLTWLAGLILRGSISMPRSSALDVLMLGWIIFGGIALAKTYDLHENLFSSLIVLRYFFITPVAYFFFRLGIKTKLEGNELYIAYLQFLKIAILYTLIEFLAVNFLGMRANLEQYFLQSSNDVRLYDSIFAAFLKPAGPIHGSQNASLLSLIAFFAFASQYRINKTYSDGIWAMLALIALTVSFTITAAIVGSLLLFYLGLPFIRKASLLQTRVIGFFSVITALTYRKEILAFRDKGLSGAKSIYYERTQQIVSASVNRFLEGISSYPFGTGWPNHLATKESTAFQPFLNSPAEIYIFKLGYYLGPFFLLFFMAIHIFIIARLILYRSRRPNDLQLQFIMTAIFSILLSLIHYESFTRTGFSYLYAFCLALLALYKEGSPSGASIRSAPPFTFDPTHPPGDNRNLYEGAYVSGRQSQADRSTGVQWPGRQSSPISSRRSRHWALP